MRRASVTGCFRKSGPGVPQRQGRASTQVFEGGADFDALTLQQLEAFGGQPGRMPGLVCKREARFRTVG